MLLCRSLNLFSDALVAIDGSKFKAVNGRDRNFTKHKLRARKQQLEESIARYLADLDRADRDPSSVTEARVEHLKEKVETVKAQMRRLKQLGKQMAKAPDEQISLTDPDARSMATSWKRTSPADAPLVSHASLLRGDPRVFHDFHPTCILLTHEGAELRGRHEADLRALVDEALLHCGVVHHF